ncbi:hypothetical protein NUW54_g3848 [Trametes sanguinea]|uniref:Uncharacterized protein n=1 Tax=Trametes sanguinea TaxID=158606 RepID=A0ACC1Q2Q2_9APHY|nr:hypothetical protein NUW54_g3848 [Trametes sanguinea]
MEARLVQRGAPLAFRPSLRAPPAAPAAPRLSLGIAEKAIREVTGEKGGLSIKGASSRGNVVQVSGLARGTTAADVEAIFKRCGPITTAVLHASTPDPVVRLTYKTPHGVLRDSRLALRKEANITRLANKPAHTAPIQHMNPGAVRPLNLGLRDMGLKIRCRERSGCSS